MSIDYNKEDHQDLSPSNILANIDIVNTKMNNKETAMVNINEVTDSKIEIKPKPQNVEKSEEDPLIEYIHSSRNITEFEIKEAPLLIIDEQSDGNIFNKTQIQINAAGLIGGRDAKDGVAIFGQNTNSEFRMDFEVKYKDTLPYPYIFAIYYQRDTKSYFIRAFSGKASNNRILFIKLSSNYSLKLKQKEVISVGDSLFQISPIEDNKMELINISDKDIDDNVTLKRHIFDPNTTKEVTIGRDPKCTFSFPKDKSFSRCQTTFEYDENEKIWVIVDGSRKKCSTNGTWVFGTHSFEIKDQMMVEILTMKVKFTLLTNDK